MAHLVPWPCASVLHPAPPDSVVPLAPPASVVRPTLGAIAAPAAEASTPTPAAGAHLPGAWLGGGWAPENTPKSDQVTSPESNDADESQVASHQSQVTSGDERQGPLRRPHSLSGCLASSLTALVPRDLPSPHGQTKAFRCPHSLPHSLTDSCAGVSLCSSPTSVDISGALCLPSKSEERMEQHCRCMPLIHSSVVRQPQGTFSLRPGHSYSQTRALLLSDQDTLTLRPGHSCSQTLPGSGPDRTRLRFASGTAGQGPQGRGLRHKGMKAEGQGTGAQGRQRGWGAVGLCVSSWYEIRTPS